ncbi:uncharacterized protein LOC131598383 [Vicia villosa]|uniref:uncharacterized protein LOC131598383 n=1 Tax=Vicia villosa TaxID=3911 RepID=UPI00273B1152|nr:uncharacterized protein LOC131598383 [Vicia villosa]
MMRTLSIWVKLPQLLLQLWGEKILSKIGSAIGVPLVTDECTTQKFLVEVDITRKLLDEITIKDAEGKKKKQMIEYEWKPKYCDKCQVVGHMCGEPIKKKVWKLKIQLESNPHVLTTPKEIPKSTAENTEHTLEDWTAVNKTTRDKGKRVLYAEPSPSVPCVNVFGNEICILLETRVKVNKAAQIRQKLHLKGRFLDNYAFHNNGRIWINWDHTHNDLRHIKSSNQFVHCGVYDLLGNFKYWLIAIYALNQLEHRRRLWTDIEHLSRTQQGPWCLIGDFNNVLQAQDKIGGNLVIENEYKDLQNMMDNTGLCEMPSKGDFYTWFNKQSSSPIYSRIDRLIANTEWLQMFSDIHQNILPPSISDHAMLHVAMNQSRRMQHSYFKFHNSLTDAIDFQDIVRHSWNLLSRGSHEHPMA